MAADLLQMLWDATLALTVALVLVLLVRVPLRRLGGATVLRWPWIAVLLAPAATLLPARELEPVMVQAMAAPAVFDASPVGLVANATTADIAWAPWLLGVWALGAVAFAAASVWQQRRFERLLGRLAPMQDGTWRASSDAGTPAVLGVVSPRIVLPSDFEQRFAPAERELAIAHERAHRAAGDTWIAAVAAVLRCVFWFNPLVHVGARCLRLDQEYACDATVLTAFPQRRRSYAEALLKAQPGPLLPIGCQWDAGRPLLARVRQLAAPLPGASRRHVGRGLAALVALLAATAAWALQPATEADGETRWIEAHVTLQPTAEFGTASPAAGEPSRVIVRSGGTFTVRMGEDGAIWEVTGSPRFDADGRIHLDVQLLRGSELEMTSSDIAIPGQTMALRSPAGDGSVGATAKITLWPAKEGAAPREHGDKARVTGRMRVSVDGRGETFFFDRAVGREDEANVPASERMKVHYLISNVTPTQATIAFRIEQLRADDTRFTVSTPTLVVERGTDASLRLDVPMDDASANPQSPRDGANAPVSATQRNVEISMTIDPV